MCKFCDTVFDLHLLYDKYRKSSISNALQIVERDRLCEWAKGEGKGFSGDFICKDVDKYGLYTGNQRAVLENIRFCPFCGRKL